MTNRLRRRARPSVLLTAALLFLALLILCAVFGPMIFSHDATATNLKVAMHGASKQHFLGTDSLGRDIFARVIVATRSTLFMAALATFVGGFIGVALGLATAAFRPRLSRLLSSAVAILVAFPPLLLAIFFAVIFGLGTRGAVLAVAAAFLPGFARLTETLARSVAHREYVEAARLLAVGRTTIARRHILPNIAEPIIVYFTVHIGIAILALSGLSFLGFGVQPPSYDWGKLLADALPSIYITPATSVGPAVAILLAGLTFNLVGEAAASRVRFADTAQSVTGTSPVTTKTVAQQSGENADAALSLRGLNVFVPGPDGLALAVRNISFTIGRGEIVGIVGESGSGKSLTALAAAQLLELPLQVSVGRHEFLGHDLSASGNIAERRRLLGTSLALIYQDPESTLNPALRIGRQLTEGARLHLGLTRLDATERAVTSLGKVALPGGRKRLRQYQHQLSGGMKQRVSIAMGLMTQPQLLIADEPTTALDVTVQAQILRLLHRIRRDDATAILLISHDIAVVSEVCDRALIMYAGHIVEEGPAELLVHQPAHPYTQALLRSTLDISTPLDTPVPVIAGRVPVPADSTPGCRFAPRCDFADDQCRQFVPPLEPIAVGHTIACWHPQSANDQADSVAVDLAKVER